MEIDSIAKEWAMVAKNANAGVGLAHHISKAGAGEATALHARGAVALINACRSVMVLNRMSEDEAGRYCIEAERRRRFFRVYDDKNNRAPPSDDSDWYQMWSVNLGNGEDGEGDSMGVVVPWSPPDAFDGVTASHLYRVQQMIDEGEWRANWQGKPWAGEAVGTVLGIDPSTKANRLRIIKLLKDWTDNGALAIVEKKDGTRQMRPFMIVGQWAVDGPAPLNSSVAVHSGAVEQPKRAAPPTPLIGGGGVAGGAGGTNSVVQNGAPPASEQWTSNPALGRQRGTILAPGENHDDPVPGWN
jgi:hypothetical protein